MSTPEHREKTRLKVRRWRQRHAAELRQKADMKLSDGPKTGRRPTWTVSEWVDSAGLPRLVIVHKHDVAEPWCDVPEAVGLDLTRSLRWLPGATMSKRACERLRRLRVAQVVAWCGGQRPTWLLP